MDFLRRQLFLILCGLGALGGVALMVTGIRAMPAVKAEMEEVGKHYQTLTTLQQNPVNDQILDATRRRIDEIVADRNAVIAKAKELYGYQPLVPEVFPDGNSEARLKFKRVYAEEMTKLWEALRAGRPATDQDIAGMKEKIEEEEARNKRLGADAPPPEPGPELTTAGVVTRAGAKKDAIVRAHLAAAQRIYCYGVSFQDAKPPEMDASLHFDIALRDPSATQAPDLAAIWKAQVGYWIQKDVVDAIVALNDEAAAAARERNEDRWVGIMPVKEVVSVRMSRGYVMPGDETFSGAPPGGYTVAVPPAASKMSFTHSASSEFYEVVQFSVKLVMDQRDVLRFVEKLCNHRAHVPLRIAYKAVEPNRALKGKIYGSEPTVNVVMDFESIMVGDVFRPMMPAKVCEENKIPCPAADTKGAGG